MITYNKKICLIGDFSVGKTSLVSRYVNNVFSEKYQTTVGVSILTRETMVCKDVRIKFILWDIAGADKLSTVSRSYLSGANGYILVADGTQKATIETALTLKASVDTQLNNPRTISLLNKHDLAESWAADAEFLQQTSQDTQWQMTSAKTGEGVEASFLLLAKRFLDDAE
jgi:small GTP-binding protein